MLPSSRRVRHPPRSVSVSILLAGVLLIFHQPSRVFALTVLRVPFTLTRSLLRAVLLVPRLPALARENTSLKSELLHHQLELSQLREALRHAQQSQVLLKAVPQGSVATVLDRSLLPTQQTVLLDKGARDGFSLDSVVLDAAGVVGRIVDVQPTTSLALLVTDPESRISSVVERSRETGLLVGRGQGMCELIYLDAEADVQEGDRVLTAGLGGTIPKGLLLGTVSRVERDEETGVASAWISPAAHLGQLEEVLCLSVRPMRPPGKDAR